jgi:transketolase
MRKELCESLVALTSQSDMIFLTGDLGFMALEPLQMALGNRFINAGVSEQNMISVSAALAKDGWKPWCYSIAPFCFARPFEQIRNDVCLHDLPVKLLGNGGGYGYGVMGPTHHAVEDYAVMLTLPNMKVYVPCFNEDVEPIIASAALWPHPCYIRLGRGELPDGHKAPPYHPWRKVISGNGAVAIAIGPIGGSAWSVLSELPLDTRPDLWIATEIPLSGQQLPHDLVKRLNTVQSLIVIEEHIQHGGLSSMLAQRILLDKISIRHFSNLCAQGLTMGVYGSQSFMRSHSNLSPEAIKNAAVNAAGEIHG